MAREPVRERTTPHARAAHTRRGALCASVLVWLAWTTLRLAPPVAEAQVVVVQPAPPPAPTMGPPVVVMPGQPRVVVTVGASNTVASDVVPTHPPPSEAIVDATPAAPAPGTFGVGYLGTFDGTDVLHGGGLRFTGHLVDVWFLDAVLGAQGASSSSRDIAEGVFLLGPRVAAPLVTPNLRVYGVLDLGVAIRSIGNRNTWGIFSTQLGGGLELGVELEPSWAIGGYVDVRAEVRVPFEREPASLGVQWSAGLALLWF